MSDVVIFDYETGLFGSVDEETINERILCFERLRNAKHHKVITANDLIKMFGISECRIGDEFEVDVLVGVTKEPTFEVKEFKGPIYLLRYLCHPKWI